MATAPAPMCASTPAPVSVPLAHKHGTIDYLLSVSANVRTHDAMAPAEYTSSASRVVASTSGASLTPATPPHKEAQPNLQVLASERIPRHVSEVYANDDTWPARINHPYDGGMLPGVLRVSRGQFDLDKRPILSEYYKIGLTCRKNAPHAQVPALGGVWVSPCCGVKVSTAGFVANHAKRDHIGIKPIISLNGRNEYSASIGGHCPKCNKYYINNNMQQHTPICFSGRLAYTQQT